MCGLYFILRNNKLSLKSFIIYKLMNIIRLLIQGLIFGDLKKIQRLFGILIGAFLSLNILIKKKNIEDLLEQHT